MNETAARENRLEQARKGVLTLDSAVLSADFFSLLEDFDTALNDHDILLCALIDAEEAMTQVIVDINDSHPRTSTLKGYTEAMRASERGVVEERKKVREALKLVGVNLREEGILE